jgi:hypothetical protein
VEVHVARTLKRWLVCCVALCGLLLSGQASAEPVTRTFALVVANNRSLSLALPDLQYADDDAARYYRLFRAAGADSNVELLATFDRTSALLYPTLKDSARAATRAELLRAVAKLKKAVDGAHAKGERATLYFVFAGHGEVAGGRGYLHLEDARIDGSFIEREIIDKVAADTKHVLLDSCNSFFVINPRKPGGRRWATPKDMALGFSARHPEVGLFLSTNSDEEVFEWSELESGVFSHEVRSGLTGAADVDANGTVTYAELGGFVAQANQGIVRENLRPQVYFSGPRGNEHASLFSTRKLAGRKLSLGPNQSRVWARGATGERLLDLHKERGALTVTLPDVSQELSIFVQAPSSSPQTPPTLVEHRIAEGPEPIQLGDSAGEPPRLAARGDQLFGSLFATPYGPVSYDGYLKQQRQKPAPVYGVKDEDVTRMGNYLTALADVDRTQRKAVGITFTAAGGLLGAGALVGRLSEPRLELGPTIGFAAVGAAFATGGLYMSLTDSEGEKTLDAFHAELRAQRGNRALAFAHTEQKLQDVARAERSRRQFTFWMMQTLGVGVATAATIGLVTDDEASPAGYALMYGAAALYSGLGFYILGVETPTERLLRLYRDDPGVKVRAGVTALPNGGFGLGVTGSF